MRKEYISGYEELAEYMGVTRRTALRYRKDYNDFPTPVDHAQKTVNKTIFTIAIYSAKDIDCFMEGHGLQPGGRKRGRKPSVEV